MDQEVILFERVKHTSLNIVYFEMWEIKYRPIGIIHTPFKQVEGTPIQPKAGYGIEGWVEVYPKYSEGLKDIEGFSHIILLYHMHKIGNFHLLVKPYMDDRAHGVFATRAPARPNPIGISVVHLSGVEGNILYVRNLDIIDGTPLLDIKPYVPEFDRPENVRIGWLSKRIGRLRATRDDGRFINR